MKWNLFCLVRLVYEMLMYLMLCWLLRNVSVIVVMQLKLGGSSCRYGRVILCWNVCRLEFRFGMCWLVSCLVILWINYFVGMRRILWVFFLLVWVLMIWLYDGLLCNVLMSLGMCLLG